MYKTNIVFIVFFIILILSSFLFYIFYLHNDNGKIFKSKPLVIYSYNGVKLISENAPPLKNLFDRIQNDSHNIFNSSSECLKCHAIGMDIKGKMEAPQIAHNIKLKDVYNLEYCISCHVLATNEKK